MVTQIPAGLLQHLLIVITITIFNAHKVTQKCESEAWLVSYNDDLKRIMPINMSYHSTVLIPTAVLLTQVMLAKFVKNNIDMILNSCMPVANRKCLSLVKTHVLLSF